MSWLLKLIRDVGWFGEVDRQIESGGDGFFSGAVYAREKQMHHLMEAECLYRRCLENVVATDGRTDDG